METSLEEDELNILQRLTITQLHILSLVNSKPNEWNNTSLSSELNVSKPAITKAIYLLMDNNYILASKKRENLKEVYYEITPQGRELADHHDRLHKMVEKKYLDLLHTFSEEELAVVTRFLRAWANIL